MKEDDIRPAALALQKKLTQLMQSVAGCLANCQALLEACDRRPPVPAAPQDETKAPAPPAPALPPADPPAVEKKRPELATEERERLVALANSTKQGRFVAAVELALSDCGDTFTRHDVVNILCTHYGWNEAHANHKVSNCLGKVAKLRGYRVLRPGSGRTPALYGI